MDNVAAKGTVMPTRKQTALPLPEVLQSTGQARVNRERLERKRERERLLNRKRLEQKATDLFGRYTRALGVDAIVADAAFDRSSLFSGGRKNGRQPMLAPFVYVLEDRAVGMNLVRELAAHHECLLVARVDPTVRRGVHEILVELRAELRAAGVLGSGRSLVEIVVGLALALEAMEPEARAAAPDLARKAG